MIGSIYLESIDSIRVLSFTYFTWRALEGMWVVEKKIFSLMHTFFFLFALYLLTGQNKLLYQYYEVAQALIKSFSLG